MRKKFELIIGVTLLLAALPSAFGQAPLWTTPPKVEPTRILHNSDVLAMVRSGNTIGQIIDRIRISHCSFDIFPPVLQDLRRRGVPEMVLFFMTLVPNGPSESSFNDLPAISSTVHSTVKMPQGGAIVVETLYPISSANFHEGSTIAFSVVRPVYVDDVLVIARGTVARAKIVKLKKAGNWGRGGELTWEMESIRAVDGTQIPVKLSAYVEGKDRGGQLVAGLALTSAIIFPYTAPAALVWGFKKGDDAIVRGSKQFAAVIESDTEVSGMLPEKDRVKYHNAEAVKAKVSAASTPTSFPRLPVRN
jgi:hypothetical protein